MKITKKNLCEEDPGGIHLLISINSLPLEILPDIM
jgi:hypothetical protein